MSGRRQSLLVNLGLALVTSAVVLGAAELAARAVERRMPDPSGEKLALWEKVWAGDFYLMRQTSAGWPPSQPINPEGLQDRAHPQQKPEGVWRVVVLGDSVTAGTPFKPAESYPAMLQARLEERGPWVEVLNVALWGWSTRQERIAFERIARRYHPDQVIVGLCLNDVEELQNNLERPPVLLAWLHRRSAFVRRLVHAETRQIHSIEDLFGDGPQVRAGYERLFAELRLLRDEVRAAGASFSILVFPVEFQYGSAPPLPRAQQRIAAFCASEGLRCLDLRPAMQPLGKQAFLDLLHFTLPGRRLVAEHVLAARLIPEQVTGTPSLAAALAAPGAKRAAETLAAPAASLAALERALDSRDERLRAEAAWAIGRRGEAAGPAAASLARALGDTHECVRAAALQALGALGSEARATLPAVLPLLGDSRETVRWRAIEAVSRIGGVGPETLPALVSALASADPYVRAGVLYVLRELGPVARPALPAITAAANDPHAGVRAIAVVALAHVGQGEASSLKALAQALSGEGDADYRWKAARALGNLGPLAKDAAPALVAAVSDDNGHVRREAIIALGRIGSAAGGAAAATLAGALEDRDPEIRRVAATALGRMRAASARRALERRAQDEDEAVRTAVARALAAMP